MSIQTNRVKALDHLYRSRYPGFGPLSRSGRGSQGTIQILLSKPPPHFGTIEFLAWAYQDDDQLELSQVARCYVQLLDSLSWSDLVDIVDSPEKLAVWTWLYGDKGYDVEVYLSTLYNLYDLKLMFSMLEMRTPKKLGYKHFVLCVSLCRQLRDCVPARDSLGSYIKAGMCCSQDKLKDFSLQPIVLDCRGPLQPEGVDCSLPDSVKRSQRVRTMPYLDGPLGFYLMWRQTPLQVLTFQYGADGSLMVLQIQGVTAYRIDESGTFLKDPGTGEHLIVKPRELFPFDYREFMIDRVFDLASLLEVKLVSIQSAANNHWTHPNYEGVVHLDYRRGEEVYDHFAEKLGFQPNASGNYVKQV